MWLQFHYCIDDRDYVYNQNYIITDVPIPLIIYVKFSMIIKWPLFNLD